MVTTIFETNLSLQDARLNTVMKKLTAWAAIIAVPTAVTGFYGQNVPYPGFGQWDGFVVSTLITLLLAVASTRSSRGRAGCEVSRRLSSSTLWNSLTPE